LELKPNADNLDAIPDLPLEDGDRMIVPFRPATVNVIGAVYNSSSFIFTPGKTVGDYLRVSGGATRNGDKGRLFVIRADGTTVSGQGHNGPFLKSFSEARLMAGDTIVVPEKLDKGAVVTRIQGLDADYRHIHHWCGGSESVVSLSNSGQRDEHSREMNESAHF